MKSWNPERRLKAALILLLVFALSPLAVNRGLASGGDKGLFEFVGPIETLPNNSNLVGDWTVGRRIVHVGTATVIDDEGGRPVVGATVEVKGTVRADGSVDATKIEVKIAASATPSPTPNGSPTPSPSPGCEDFKGAIQTLPNTAGFIGDWNVNGRIVHVTSATVIRNDDGAATVVGAFVEVNGCQRADGSTDATGIEVKRADSTKPGEPCMSFFGTIQSLPGAANFVGDWTVAGRTVHVSASTLIKTEHGAVSVGSSVEIKGCLQTDGTFNASIIEVEGGSDDNPKPSSSTEFFGAVQTLPGGNGLIGDWTVGGRTVHVTAGTRIEHLFRPLVIGALVKVEGTIQADQSINASEIKVARSNDTDHRINSFEVFGDVNALPAGPPFIGDWTVNNLTVHVTAATEVEQEAERPLLIGSRVVVIGTQRADQSIDAIKIAVLKSVDKAKDFVGQNYEDFLNRKAEAGGLDYWTSQIAKCGDDPACVDRRRVEVSAAFFLSKEFQETGYFVYRYYEASFGREPKFVEFLPDTQAISKDSDKGEAVIENNKHAFGDDFVRHPAFAALYDLKTNAEFVDLLFANAGVTPTQSERDALVNGLNNGTETRATVLRKVVDNPAFFQQEFNSAFVLMQYFGYLRRDPERDGYLFWLNIMNRLNGDFKKADMVKAFLISIEYNDRFRHH
jgi:hypothetical protein